MVIQRKDPRYPRRGPSCLLVLFVMVGVGLGAFVIANAQEVRETIIPTPIPTPTRSATEYALLAELDERDGHYQEAIENYEKAIRLDGTKPAIYIDLIELLVQEGQTEKALTVATQAAVLDPENDRVWQAMAAAYLADGGRLADLGDSVQSKLQYAEAVQAARKAIEINPQNATAYAYAAGGLVLQEDPELYQQAEIFADDAVRLEPDNPIARLYMGKVFTYQGYYDLAVQQAQLGIEANPEEHILSELYIDLAYNFYGGFNSTRDAVITFQDAVAIDPDNAAAYDGLAHMYLQLGDNALAEENALQSVELNPNVARAQGRLGEAYYRQNNYPKAIEALERAVGLYQEPTALNARFFNMLATSYVRDTPENCPEAIPIFQDVLAVAVPESPVALGALDGLEECRQASLQGIIP